MLRQWWCKRLFSSQSWRPNHTANANDFLFITNTIARHAHSLSNHQSLYNVLQTCKLTSNLTTANAIHARIVKLGYETTPSLAASLIFAYVNCNHHDSARKLVDKIPSWSFDLLTANSTIAKFMKTGDYDVAKKVFDKMLIRDAVTWNSMIGGYVRNSFCKEALKLFKKMLSTTDVEPDGFTFASVITGCARLGALSHAEWIRGLMMEKRIEMNFILSSALIDMYSKCGRVKTAKEVFDSVKRDNVSVWNAMINGLAIHGLASEALALFSQMKEENVMPDCITFVGILKACSHCGLIEHGRQFFDQMRRHYSIAPQLEHYGAMVDLLARAGHLEEAYAIIEAMPMKPDVVIWRAVLSACRTYKKPELGEVALANISHLESGDYVLLSNTYCSLNKWDSAERMRETMKRKGVHKNRAKSWVEVGCVIHHFKAGDQSHPEIESVYKMLEGLIQRTKLEGFIPATELVLMDVSEEEKEGNLYCHSEKLALAYGILRTSPGTEIRISKNLRTCHDCHSWMKMVSRVLGRVIIVRDRIRFHLFEGGFCSCRDYW